MLGAQLKQDYNKVQEEWLEDPDHLQQWEAQTISAGDRRILITLRLAEAAKRFRNRGLLVSAVGSAPAAVCQRMALETNTS